MLTAAGTAGIFKVSFYRGSEHTPSMRQTAIAANRGGLICFETGQGAGVTGLRSLCWVIGMAHSVGLRVVVHVAGSADRLVRTGMYLAISVLENAGVEVRFAKGRAGDNPHEEGLQQSRERYRTVAGRLEKRINRFVKRLARKGLEPGFELRLPESVLKIRGIRSTLAAGAGLDFISALEVSDLTKASRTVRTMAMNSAAFRPVMGADGFWLVEPGLRARKGLVTKITPILVEGYEGECLALLRRRWPSATFGKEIVLPHPGSDPDVSWLNILNLQIESQTIYAAIDHASVHWGSPLDLDVWFRQHRSVLMTVLPSTHLFPDIGINAVRHCSNALMKLSKRMKP